jgi:hypothetical protein
VSVSLLVSLGFLIAGTCALAALATASGYRRRAVLQGVFTVLLASGFLTQAVSNHERVREQIREEAVDFREPLAADPVVRSVQSDRVLDMTESLTPVLLVLSGVLLGMGVGQLLVLFRDRQQFASTNDKSPIETNEPVEKSA